MKEWYAGLAQRERVLVTGAAILLVLLLLYAMIWQPLSDAYLRMQKGVQVQQDTLTWMQQASQQIKGLKGQAGRGNRGFQGSLLAVVDRSAQAAGLGQAMKRVEPEGRDGVRVWLEGASFDSLISWLGTLASQGAEVSTITLERQDIPGRVDARVNLKDRNQ